MYWFTRPPYLRRIGAALLIVVAAWVDLRPTDTVPYPFAAADLTAGSVIDTAAVEWRDVPRGLLPLAPATEGTVRFAIARGEPITSSIVSGDRPSVPEGWWALSTIMPDTVVPGQKVQLVVTGATPRAYPGIVIEPPPPPDPLAYQDPIGLVAVPADSAVAVAAATAEGAISVLVGPVP
ncbi:MAG: SAF domain-containing protein [Acidimicrobiia bacterium]